MKKKILKSKILQKKTKIQKSSCCILPSVFIRSFQKFLFIVEVMIQSLKEQSLVPIFCSRSPSDTVIPVGFTSCQQSDVRAEAMMVVSKFLLVQNYHLMYCKYFVLLAPFDVKGSLFAQLEILVKVNIEVFCVTVFTLQLLS